MYELWDTSTGNVVAESDTIEALAEVEVELRDSGADISSLQILQLNDDGSYAVVVE